MNYTRKLFSMMLLATFSLALLFVTSCNDDDKPDDGGDEVSLTELIAAIDEAKALLVGAEEGFEKGKFGIGSIAKLQGVIDDAQAVVDSEAPSAALIDNALTQLRSAITTFQESEVITVANPWVQQVTDNRILLTDSDAGSDRGLLSLVDIGKDFTIELMINPVSLNIIDFSQSLISTAKQFNADASASVDDGFHVRYFDKGEMQFIVGAPGGSWSEIERTPEGTLKAEEWQHVAYVHSNGEQILYVNGVEVGKGQFEYQSTVENTALAGIGIGNAFDWNNRIADAMFKDIRVWSKALAPEDQNQQGLLATGSGLEAWFPLASEQGSKIVDVSGNYEAILGDFVVWAPEGNPDLVVVDYSELEKAISDAETFINDISEGTSAGDHGIGTSEWLQSSIDQAQTVLDEMGSGADVAGVLEVITSALETAKANTVVGGAANGFKNDSGETGAMRITPNWHALGESFTIEGYFKPTELGGDIWGNGEVGVFHVGGNGDSLRYYYADASKGAYVNAFSPTPVMVAGTDHHIALVYDKTAMTMTLYLDKEELTTTTEVGGLLNLGWGEFWVGATWGFSKGTFREFRIWNEAKTAEGLDATISDATAESTLEVYLPFNLKDATLFKDATGKHFVEQRGAVEWVD
ncbi:MAG: LamG domain-containing protein [Cyclobacteriaceae bacterium]